MFVAKTGDENKTKQKILSEIFYQRNYPDLRYIAVMHKLHPTFTK